jgi:hypothetical protein
MPREAVAGLSIALTIVAVPLRPTGIISIVAPVVVRGLPVVPWTAAERPGLLVISIPRSEVRLPPVGIANAVVGGSTVPAIRGVSVLLVARVIIARIKIEHARLRRIPLQCRYAYRVYAGGE